MPTTEPTVTPVPTDVPTDTPTDSPVPTAQNAPTDGPGAAVVAAPNVSTATQSPAPSLLPQLLPVAAQPGTAQGWVVRWDASARYVAIWVADPGSESIGRLSLFSILVATGLVDTNEPLLAAGKVMAGIQFDDGHLVYTSAVDGKTYMQAIPAVPPSNVATPVPTTGAKSGSSPQTSDQPGS